MDTGVEGIGEAVTGGMAARAVEPAAGEAGAVGNSCLNCGTAVNGRYCSECGQATHVHRTLGAFWHELLHGVLHFEGKIWRTLPMLAWKPGELTRRYVEGERARFVSPIALFLFSVFLMFAFFSMMGASLIGFGDSNSGNLAAELREADTAISQLEERRRVLVSKRQKTEDIDRQIREARTARDFVAAAGGIQTDGPMVGTSVKTGWERLDKGINKANRNPALLFYKLQTNAYKFSWALIPISVPFLWLLFLHRRRYRQHYHAYDHVVFVTYSIAFFSLLAIALVGINTLGVGGGVLGLAFMLIPPIHMYKQLRGAYALSRFSALWRTFFLIVFATISMTLFLLLLLALGVLG